MTGTLNLLVFQGHSILENGDRRTSDGHGRSIRRKQLSPQLAPAGGQPINWFRSPINQASLKKGACFRHGSGVC